MFICGSEKKKKKKEDPVINDQTNPKEEAKAKRTWLIIWIHTLMFLSLGKYADPLSLSPFCSSVVQRRLVVMLLVTREHEHDIKFKIKC